MNRVFARIGVVSASKVDTHRAATVVLERTRMTNYKLFNNNTLVICDLRPR